MGAVVRARDRVQQVTPGESGEDTPLLGIEAAEEHSPPFLHSPDLGTYFPLPELPVRWMPTVSQGGDSPRWIPTVFQGGDSPRWMPTVSQGGNSPRWERQTMRRDKSRHCKHMALVTAALLAVGSVFPAQAAQSSVYGQYLSFLICP